MQYTTFKIIRTIDGDTIVADIYLGFDIWLNNQHIRIYGINAPEIHGDSKLQGLSSKQRVEDLVKTAKALKMVDSRGKFGRLLGDIVLDDDRLLSDVLVEENLAVRKDY